MNIAITYTNGEKKKYDSIIEIYKPNNSQIIMLMDSTGINHNEYTYMIKKIEVKP